MVVQLWERIFKGLSYVSVFYILRKLFRGSSTLPEVWAVGNLVGAIIAPVLVMNLHASVLMIILGIYGALRTFEIIVYQVNVILFDEYRAKKQGKKYLVRGYRRLILLLLHNYVEIICWFAVIYLNLPGSIQILSYTHSVLGPLYASFITMTNYGASNAKPVNGLGMCVIWTQSVIGFSMTLICFGRFLSLLPLHESMDQHEK